jgi:transcriptional regulator with XRE-family HTH domain
MIEELERLNQHRLDNDLTYKELAAQVGISDKALYALLQEHSSQPFDRTLHKIRKFLEARDEAAKAPTRRKAARA